MLSRNLQSRLTRQLDFLSSGCGHVGQRIALEILGRGDLAHVRDRAGARKASRKRSEERFSEANSNSLVMKRVQVTTEQRARPTITVWATLLASRNIWKGVSLPAFLIVTGSGGAVVDEAASEAAASEEAVAAAGSLEAVCAKAGALAISAKAPIRAMRGSFLW